VKLPALREVLRDVQAMLPHDAPRTFELEQAQEKNFDSWIRQLKVRGVRVWALFEEGSAQMRVGTHGSTDRHPRQSPNEGHMDQTRTVGPSLLLRSLASTSCCTGSGRSVACWSGWPTSW
jgi:hypothetical protein